MVVKELLNQKAQRGTNTQSHHACQTTLSLAFMDHILKVSHTYSAAFPLPTFSHHSRVFNKEKQHFELSINNRLQVKNEPETFID